MSGLRGGDVGEPARPLALIRLELDTALAYQAAAGGRPPADAYVAEMRRANEAEIERLRAEMDAMSSVAPRTHAAGMKERRRVH